MATVWLVLAASLAAGDDVLWRARMGGFDGEAVMEYNACNLYVGMVYGLLVGLFISSFVRFTYRFYRDEIKGRNP